MKRAMKSKVAIAIVFAMVLTMIQGVFSTDKALAASVWPSVTNAKYMKCFTISTRNNTPAYSKSDLKKQIGTIYASDELYVYAINDVWAYLSYPTKKGRKYGYVSTSVITKNNQGHSVGKATGKATTYRRAGSISYGYIEAGDYVMKVSSSGNYTQIIYSAGKLWKMGWLRTANYNKCVSSTANQNNVNVNASYSCGSSAGYVAKYSSNAVRCYTLASTGKLYAYSDVALRNKTANRYIACATDECYIQGLNLTYGSVKLSYPTASGRKSMYFRIADILATPSSTPKIYYADHKIYTYRWAGSTQYGYINCENVAVLGSVGAYTQILYSIGSGYYKIGFIKTSDMSSTVSAFEGNNNQTDTNLSIVQKMVKFELSQEGVGDNKGNNNVIYNTWYYGRQVSGNGYAWCQAFQSYACKQITGSNNAIPKTASCTSAVNTFKGRGQFKYSKYYGGNYTPKAGDLVYYTNGSKYSSCHVGMIISAPVNGYLQTIEGNIKCSDGNWKVVRFTKNAKRQVNSSYVLGYATPAY